MKCYFEYQNWITKQMHLLFYHVLCILTNFRLLHIPESWLKYFFWAIFNLFWSRPAFACLPALKSSLKCCFFKGFFLISDEKSLKKVWNEQKRLKTAQKSILTSFRVRAAPKSWSKYTTIMSQKKHFNIRERRKKNDFHLRWKHVEKKKRSGMNYWLVVYLIVKSNAGQLIKYKKRKMDIKWNVVHPSIILSLSLFLSVSVLSFIQLCASYFFLSSTYLF